MMIALGVAGKVNAGNKTHLRAPSAMRAADNPAVQLLALVMISSLPQKVLVRAASNSRTTGPKFENHLAA
jgi:hypothetical protein